jgi:uncharacterized protein (TIGR03437 family)
MGQSPPSPEPVPLASAATAAKAGAAQLNSPQGIAVDSAGNIYISDGSNYRVRKVAGGVITTVAGNGTPGFSGDNGPATSAGLSQIFGLAFDSSGNLYVADAGDQRIRKVSNGTITTVAGIGFGNGGGLGDNGPATSAQLSFPEGVAVDSSGNLFIADTDNNRIRKVTSGVITTIAGGGAQFGDNGPATNAQMDQPAAVAVDSSGHVYVADTVENRVRLLTFSASGCAYSLSPTSLQAQGIGGTFNVAIQTGASCPWSVTGLPSWITVSGASSGAGPATVAIVIAPNATTGIFIANFSVAGVAFTATLLPGTGGPSYGCTNSPAPIITSIDSASSYGGYAYFASGSWLEIKGTNLANPGDPRLQNPTQSGQWTMQDFNGVNAPTSLDDISVFVNGKAAYVWYLSPTQLNVQAPEDAATGNVAITVFNCEQNCSPAMFAKQALAPGMLAPPSFNLGGTSYLAATFVSDGAYALSTSAGAALGVKSRPAKPGDVIIAYGIGFGDVTPSILPGVIAEQSNTLVNPVTISFGSAPAALSYAGLAGGFVGLYEFYITVPPGLANGDYQINVTQNVISVPQTMYLTVHN